MGQEDPAEEAERVGDKATQVGPPGGELGDEAERGGCILVGNGGREAGEGVPVGKTEGPGDRFGRSTPPPPSAATCSSRLMASRTEPLAWVATIARPCWSG